MSPAHSSALRGSRPPWALPVLTALALLCGSSMGLARWPQVDPAQDPAAGPDTVDPESDQDAEEPEARASKAGKQGSGDPQAEGASSPAPQGEAQPAVPARWQPRYRDLAATTTLLNAWALAHPDRARFFLLAASYGGREVPALEFGTPGPIPLGERPTVLLVGGLDGVSIAGCEAALSVAAAFFEGTITFPDDVALLVVPQGSPDGLASWVAGRGGDGRNARALDDDGDGRADEDPADDLDGDGRILDMLIEDPKGPWARCDDARFLRPAMSGDAPRYRLQREGRDDDGDERFNEDGPGGVVLDHNFPIGWRGPWDGVAGGPWPLSEPLARALADLALRRQTFAVLVLQGNHGQLAAPGGEPADVTLALPYPEDEVLHTRWARRFGARTGRAQSELVRLRDAYGEGRPGAAIDWFYAGLGAFALELAVWGPRVGRTDVGAVDALFESGAGATGDVVGADAAWREWLDDERAGIGFLDWTPVELAPSEGRVGGWEPRTRQNPTEEALVRSLAGVPEFVAELAGGRPRLEIEIREPVRDGRVVRLRARVRNRGILPSGIAREGLFGRAGLTLALELPRGARRLAGAAIQSLAHVPGGGSSAEVEWLLLLPEGTSLKLVAKDDWTLPVSRELRL